MNSVLRIGHAAAIVAGCAALLAPALANAGATKLDLINGWKDGAFGAAKAAVWSVKGVVHFQGAISTTGTSDEPFVLPAAFRPQSTVYVKVDLCDAANGRLQIDPSGGVSVQAENDFADAQCFTSLDGATFALEPDTYKPLKLKNGWKPYGFGTANPAVKNIDGIVHLAGAMGTKKDNAQAFILAPKYQPAAGIFFPVDMCGATNGRLISGPGGGVGVQAETGFGNAQCFTSLDGASFATDSSGFTTLTLINGWTPYGQNDTRTAAVKIVNGVVQFEGAIATRETNAVPFVLPASFRPSHPVWIPVDMNNATNGRLAIGTDGTVTVEAEDDFNNAAAFTSLEGASFHL